MKRIVLFATLFLLIASAVSADSMTVNSDTTNEYYDGSDWQSAVAVSWIHPAWSSYISIPATWIWDKAGVTQDESVQGSTVNFRKVFEIPSCATGLSGSIDITTDNEYTLSLNSNLVGSDTDWTDAENYDISSDLQTGTNVFEIEAVNEAMSGGTPTKNPAGVIYSATITYDCEQEIPEFTTIGAGLVLLAAALIAYRKKKK